MKHFFLRKSQVLSALIALSLVTSSCSTTQKSISSNFAKSDIVTRTNSGSVVSYTNKSDSAFNRKGNDLRYINISLSDFDLQQFIDYVSTYDSNYIFKDLYNIDNVYNKEIDTIRSSAIKNNKEELAFKTANDLKNTVLLNNDKFLESIGAMKSFYHELDDKSITKICDIIIESIKYEIDNSDISISEINAVLKNLKIFKKTMGCNASVSEEDVLCVNDYMIKCMETINSDKTDVYKSILIHESNHIIEKNSYQSIEASKVRINGVSTYIYGNRINPLNWTWLSEACAEQEMSNRTGNDTMTYDYMIGYLNSLKFATLFNENHKKSLEQINLSKDFDGLLKKFGISGQNSKEDFYNMMYSLEIIEKEDADFFNLYKDQYGVDVKNDLEKLKDLKFNLKSSICLSLTKYYYSFIANVLSQKGMSLSDLFFLSYLFECDINVHLNLNDEDNLIDYTEFMNQFSEIQEFLFSIISYKLDMNPQDFYSEYYTYGTITEDGNENYCLTWLNNEQRKFISDNINTYQKNATSTIRSVVQNQKRYSLTK